MGWFTTFLLSLLWYVQALKPSSVAGLEGKTLHCSLKQLHKPAFVLIGLPFGTRSHVTIVFWLWEICRKHLGKISDSFIFFSSLRAARRRRRIMKLPICSEYFLKCLIYNLPLFLADLPGNSQECTFLNSRICSWYLCWDLFSEKTKWQEHPEWMHQWPDFISSLWCKSHY